MARQSAKKQAEAAAEPETQQLSYRVTVMLEDGTSRTEELVNPDRIPVKGESFEYEHHEVRTGQVTRVEQVDEDGNVEQLTNLSEVHHEVVEPEAGDDVALDEVLPSDEEVAPETEEELAANTEG